jgi:hypothetical protein
MSVLATRPRTAFSALALDYFRVHAIVPDVAAAIGVREEDETLIYPNAGRNGEVFERRRPLSGKRTYQPLGQPLALWWLLRRPVPKVAIGCEGEGDGQAAVSAMPLTGFSEQPAVFSTPGVGYPAARLANDLREAGVEKAILAFDADEAGREFTVKVSAALANLGVQAVVLAIPDGQDLADCLYEAHDPSAWLSNAIADAEASAAEFTADQAEQPAPVPTSWGSVDLGALLDGDELEEPPTMLRRTDAVPLLYAGKIHSLGAEPEAGKGWTALSAAVEVLSAGGHVWYFDFEDGPAAIVARLLSLGASPEAIRSQFYYVRPDEPLSETAWRDLASALEQPPKLAVIDGVTEASVMHGLEISSNEDAAKWIELLPRPLARAGCAVLQLDHVVKDKDARGRYAIGAQHKLAGVDVAYAIEVVEPFGRGLDGSARLIINKDRPGYVRQHAVGKRIAEMRFLSRPDGAVDVRLDPPEQRSASFRPTVLMERMSLAIEANPGLSKNGIRGAVRGKNEHKDLALELLLAEDYVRVKPEGQSHHHFSIRPYRESEDESA